MKADIVYKELMEYVLYNGAPKSDRTGTGTFSTFGNTIKFDLREGFPLLTTKKMPIKSIIHELLWFLNGDTNIKYLVDNKVSIWDEWAYERYKRFLDEQLAEKSPDEYEYENPDVVRAILDEDGRIYTQKEFIEQIRLDKRLPGDFGRKATFASVFGQLGPIYGAQWRGFGKVTQENMFGDVTTLLPGVDQVKELIEALTNKPDDRRMIVSAWNPCDIKYMALPPCHAFWQLYTDELSLFERKKYWCDSVGKSIHYAEDFDHTDLDERGVPKRYISMLWFQRSVDTFLGLPFNIASYAALLMMLGQQLNMIPKELTGMLGDTHIYKNHVEQVRTQLWNDPLKYASPKLIINKAKDIFSYKIEDFKLEGYESFPKISAPVAV